MFKKAFDDDGIEDYSVVELSDREDCEEIQDYLEILTGARSVSILLYLQL